MKFFPSNLIDSSLEFSSLQKQKRRTRNAEIISVSPRTYAKREALQCWSRDILPNQRRGKIIEVKLKTR